MFYIAPLNQKRHNMYFANKPPSIANTKYVPVIPVLQYTVVKATCMHACLVGRMGYADGSRQPKRFLCPLLSLVWTRFLVCAMYVPDVVQLKLPQLRVADGSRIVYFWMEKIERIASLHSSSCFFVCSNFSTAGSHGIPSETNRNRREPGRVQSSFLVRKYMYYCSTRLAKKGFPGRLLR